MKLSSSALTLLLVAGCSSAETTAVDAGAVDRPSSADVASPGSVGAEGSVGADGSGDSVEPEPSASPSVAPLASVESTSGEAAPQPSARASPSTAPRPGASAAPRPTPSAAPRVDPDRGRVAGSRTGARRRRPGVSAHSSSSSPNNAPTNSSIASNGSARTRSERSAASTSKNPCAVHRKTVSVSTSGSTTQ